MPGFKQLGSSPTKVNCVPVVQVTILSPLLRPELEHFTSTVVPGTIGNCTVVSSLLVHSAFSPEQPSVDK